MYARLCYFVADWVLTTNHRRLAILYFAMIAVTGFTGLVLATIIRLELAYPGQYFLAQNAERYLTTISLHGIVMVFFVVIPVLFGAFGNFLLPTQLGIRDVAFPRLNSFMFWVTPAGFVMLLHILLFDRAYNVTYWLNYSELRAQLRRRYTQVELPAAEFRTDLVNTSALGVRLHTGMGGHRGALIQGYAPQLEARPYNLATSSTQGGIQAPGVASAAWGQALASRVWSEVVCFGDVLVGLVGILTHSRGGNFFSPLNSGKLAANVTMLDFSLTPNLEPSCHFGVGAAATTPTPLWVTPHGVGSSAATVSSGAQSLGSFVALPTQAGVRYDVLQDWRELKLEREVWRSLDLLGLGRQSLAFRQKYYADLFEPASMTSKVSS